MFWCAASQPNLLAPLNDCFVVSSAIRRRQVVSWRISHEVGYIWESCCCYRTAQSWKISCRVIQPAAESANQLNVHPLDYQTVCWIWDCRWPSQKRLTPYSVESNGKLNSAKSSRKSSSDGSCMPVEFTHAQEWPMVVSLLEVHRSLPRPLTETAI